MGRCGMIEYLGRIHSVLESELLYHRFRYRRIDNSSVRENSLVHCCFLTLLVNEIEVGYGCY